MRNLISISTALTFILFSSAAFAGISQNSKIPSGDALLIGGEQPGWIEVDGQNRGKTKIELIVRDGEKSKTLAIIEPGKGFNESIPKNRTLVIHNVSEDEAARVYWHISRYSKLANARIESKTN